MIYLYRIILLVILPIYIVFLGLRILKGKEDKFRFLERFGISFKKRPTGCVVWFHVASVGETHSIMFLVNRLLSIYKNKINILITTTTVTSAKIIASKQNKQLIHQFIPFDNFLFTKFFLNKWQPDLAIWSESELWPEIIHSASQKCPTLLINGRLSERSFKTWRKLKFFAKVMLKKFDAIYPQSQIDKKYFSKLTGDYHQVIGNIKYAAEKSGFDSKFVQNAQLKIADKIVLLAASTHEGDEAKIIHVTRNLRKQFPNLLTIIAPRHPQRIKNITKLLTNEKFSIRSKGDDFEPDIDYYIADSLGEMGNYYYLADLVFIAGSFNNGGHNPIEPAFFAKSIIVGPNMKNFKEITKEFLEHRALIKIADNEELELTIQNLLNNKNLCSQYGENAYNLVVNKRKMIKERYFKEIQQYVEPKIS